MTKPNLRVVESAGTFHLEDELMPLVKPGVYSMAYDRHETRKFFGNAQKVVFWFRIVEFGDAFEKVVPRFYNVKRIKGKPGKNGDFVPGRNSDFLREYCGLFTNPIHRLDRLSLSVYRNVIIKGRVRTTERNRRQRELPDILKYSVVEELLEVEK